VLGGGGDVPAWGVHQDLAHSRSASARRNLHLLWFAVIGAEEAFNPRPSDYEATATRKTRVDWARQRSSDKMTGKLEQASASQNIGHVIGRWQQAGVTIRPAITWQGKHSNSSANVRIDSKAAGQEPIMSNISENLALLNNGINGEAVPATVPE
jgi:hypothetical protein